MRGLAILTFFNVVVLLFLIFRLGIPFVNETKAILTESDSIAFFLSAQANQFAMLQVLLAVFGIGLAVAAFWGYIEIKTRAEEKAEKTVKEEVPKLFIEMLNKHSKEELEKMIIETKMTKPVQQKYGDELFQEGNNRMFKDPLEME